ncbi:MAG: PD-(D/E)XK nuclease family protein [Acidimicrobiales bacterium]
MIDHVETVGFGRPATEALARHIGRAKTAGPLHPVTVVVASNFVGLSVRRLLASGRLGGTGLANVSFLTPFQVGELLAPGDMGGRRPLTNPVLGAAVRQALVADPGPFGEVASHPATEAAVAALYGELSQVSEATLDAVAAHGGPTAALSVRLFRDVDSRLQGFSGEPELADAVARRPDLAQAVGALGAVVWHLPEPVTPALERMLAAVLAVAGEASVVVGRTGVEGPDALTGDMLARLGITVTDDAGVGAPPVASSLVSAPDPDLEVREAVRRVLAFAESGISLDRIGIFHPTPDPYAGLLRHHLSEAGVPFNGPSRERLADSVVGRTLLGAVALPDGQWRRDRVMALVAGAPVRQDGALARPSAWEVVSRTAGVVQGLDDWRRKLSVRRAHIDSRLAEAHDRDDTARIDRLGGDIADVDALGRFVDELASAVGEVTRSPTWTAKASAARDLVTRLLGDEHSRRWWPEADQEAAERVDAALSRLSALDEVDPRPSHQVFVRALTSELEVGRGRIGRFGQGVTFGPLATAPGQDLDAVILLGLAEGTCPGARREDSLLPDAARALAAPGELTLRAGRLDDQHRAVLAALAAAPIGHRVMTAPRADLRRSGERLPSRWFLDSASARAGHRVRSADLVHQPSSVVEVVESYADGLRSATTPASLLERDLGELSRLADAGADLAQHDAVTGSVRRGLAAVAARRSPAFTEWDGNVAGMAVPSPSSDGTALSPTGLEQWAACGFRYFLDHVLRVRDRDEPERVHELSALDRGSGVHSILERFFAEVIASGAPAPDEPWSADRRARLQEIAVEEFAALERSGRTGRAIGWRLERERLAALVDGFLTVDERYRATWRSRPAHVEMPFGLGGRPPVVIDLPDGRSVRFRGLADRVDSTDDGGWVVLDYKTGRGDKYRHLDSDEFLGGTTLQLGLYAEAARQHLGGGPTSSYYWMVDERAGFAPQGYDWTDERRERLVDLLEVMVDAIESGVFPAVPGEWSTRDNSYEGCRFCEFDRVCPGDRGLSAAVKVDAPQLAVRRRLAPPDTDTDTSPEDRTP